MNDIIMRKIQNILKDHVITKYDYLTLSNYFQRLYIEASVQDNILKYIDNSNIQIDDNNGSISKRSKE